MKVISKFGETPNVLTSKEIGNMHSLIDLQKTINVVLNNLFLTSTKYKIWSYPCFTYLVCNWNWKGYDNDMLYHDPGIHNINILLLLSFNLF